MEKAKRQKMFDSILKGPLSGLSQKTWCKSTGFHIVPFNTGTGVFRVINL